MRISSQGNALSDAELEVVEKLLPWSLPEAYRAFLLKHNGGKPIPPMVPIQGVPNNPEARVQVLFGVTRPIESSNLGWNWHTYSADLPQGLLPIARTGTGHIFCLGIAGSFKGSVLFWDTGAEYVGTGLPGLDHFYHVADSFDSFLSSFREEPKE
ncbi:MAG: SMI1/KNR4 family protein [Planctomycetes bacterium]|nr:SMI1/KNR4 family protein [Planctomycetota bacterium]